MEEQLCKERCSFVLKGGQGQLVWFFRMMCWGDGAFLSSKNYINLNPDTSLLTLNSLLFALWISKSSSCECSTESGLLKGWVKGPFLNNIASPFPFKNIFSAFEAMLVIFVLGKQKESETTPVIFTLHSKWRSLTGGHLLSSSSWQMLWQWLWNSFFPATAFAVEHCSTCGNCL